MRYPTFYDLHFRFGQNTLLKWVLGLGLILPLISVAQPVTFDQERVTISIEQNRVNVLGLYYLENRSNDPAGQIIHYPFASEAGQQFPHAISVIDLDTQLPLPYNRTANAVVFPVTIAGAKKFAFQVEFTQTVSRPEFTYILTTTRSWHRPLEQAEFIITLAPELQLTSVNLPYDYNQTLTGDRQRYFITRKNFMPDENLVITWEGAYP